jgi:hypothetical protein
MLDWQRLLNLSDWRIIKSDKPSPFMAEVYDFEDEHKLVRYKVGEDFKHTKVTPESIEATAIHEMLHVRLHPLIQAVSDYGIDAQEVVEREHEIIIVLEPLLLHLAKLTREKK